MPTRQVELDWRGVHGSNSGLTKESKPVYPKKGGPTYWLWYNPRWRTEAKYEDVAEDE